MKKFTMAFLCLVLFISVSATAFAAELNEQSKSGSAVITTQIPQTHTLKVITDSNSNVYLDDVLLNNSSTEIERLSKINLQIFANKDYKISSAVLNGIDVTDDIENGILRITNIYEDKTLVVKSENANNDLSKESSSRSGLNYRNSEPPKTGDGRNIVLYMTMMSAGVFAVFIIFKTRKKLSRK